MPIQTRRPIRVLIIDDHAPALRGLATLVENQQDLAVVVESSKYPGTSYTRPDIILFDLDFGATSGLKLLSELIDAADGLRLIMLTGVRDPELYAQALERSPIGVMVTEQAARALIEVIGQLQTDEGAKSLDTRKPMAHGVVETPEVTEADADAAAIAMLTKREWEIVALICEGLKNDQIAERLMLSERTVRHHLSSIFGKLSVDSRLELVVYAFHHGLARVRHPRLR